MDAEQRYANVFRVAVREWWDTTTGNEKGLVKTLSEKINGEEGMSFTSVNEAFIPEFEVFPRAYMDMVFVLEQRDKNQLRYRLALRNRLSSSLSLV
jgi:hypothetical protein